MPSSAATPDKQRTAALPLGSALLVVNRKSASGEALAEELPEALRAADVAVEVCQSSSIKGCEEDILASEQDFIAVAGGDGTLHSMLPALLQAQKPVLFIPAGTANDFARAVDLPLEQKQTIDVLNNARVKRVDVGMVNDIPFINVAHLGLAVTAKADLSHDEKHWLGMLSYASSGLRASIKHRDFEATLSIDGKQRIVRSTQVSVGNSGYFGGGWQLAPDVSLDDGLLDICIVRPASVWQRTQQFLYALVGQQKSHEAFDFYTASAIEIDTGDGKVITADGEEVTRIPATFSIKPAALPVLLPSDH